MAAAYYLGDDRIQAITGTDPDQLQTPQADRRSFQVV